MTPAFRKAAPGVQGVRLSASAAISGVPVKPLPAWCCSALGARRLRDHLSVSSAKTAAAEISLRQRHAPPFDC